MHNYQFTPTEEKMFDRLPIPLAVYQWQDEKVVTIFVNQSCVALFDFQDKAEAIYALNHDMYRYTHPDDVARVADIAYRFAVEGGDYFNAVYRTRTEKRESYDIIHSIGKHVFMPDGTRVTFVAYLDETAALHGQLCPSQQQLLKSLEENVRLENYLRNNQYDDLTGLPTMSYFFQLAGAWLKKVLQQDRKPVMLYIDISGMKFYNHRYGLHAGDQLLRGLGLLLRNHFGAEYSSRFGEDHFAAFTSEEKLAEQIHHLFVDWQQLKKGALLPLRVGIYKLSFAPVGPSLASDRAKFACDLCRSRDTSAYMEFDGSMQRAMEDKEYVLSHFFPALEKKEILAYFQPIVRAGNGQLCNEEALARWHDPERGLLTPDKFIPTLEDAGLLYKLDLYMVEQIIAYQQEKKRQGLPVVPISVNLSEKDFWACNMIEEICQRLEKAHLNRKALVVEITERSIGQDPALLHSIIDKLHQKGFTAWLDDFGSEYSSLNILQDYQFELIKLDMKFLRSLATNPMSRLIIQSIIGLANKARLEVLSEGVETKEQIKFLKKAGCLKLQGYFYGKPASAKERLARLQRA